MSNKGQFLTEVRDTIFSIDDISSAKAKKERETMHDIIIRQFTSMAFADQRSDESPWKQKSDYNPN